jgi:hypothetical protein
MAGPVTNGTSRIRHASARPLRSHDLADLNIRPVALPRGTCIRPFSRGSRADRTVKDTLPDPSTPTKIANSHASDKRILQHGHGAKRAWDARSRGYRAWCLGAGRSLQGKLT